MNVFDILSKYHRELFSGILVTIQICGIVYPLGILLGTLLGIGRHKWPRGIGMPSALFSLLLSSTPLIVLLFWLHYPLQYMLDIVVDPFITSVFALSMIMIVWVSDIVRNALNDFPKELRQAALVYGLSRRVAILRVELPLVFRRALPSILVSMINILQATLFTSLISVPEIFRVAQQINSEIYRPVEIYTALAIFFISICAILNILSYWLKSKYKWSLADS
jgi:polar amino acid transport system permease protein